MKKRRDWFHRMAEAYMVLWWVPHGHRPTVPEAIERLAQLRRAGPTPAAFTLRELFLPDGSRPAGVAAPDSPCPA